MDISSDATLFPPVAGVEDPIKAMRRQQSSQKQASGGQLSLRPHKAQSAWRAFCGKGGGVDDLLAAKTLDPRALLAAAAPGGATSSMETFHCHILASPVVAALLRGKLRASSDGVLRERLGEELLATRLLPLPRG